MNTEYIERAKEVGIGYANRLCADFIEYEYRGKPYPRAKFSCLCGRIASVSLFTCFSDDEWFSLTDTQLNELKSMCYRTAVERAKEILDKEPGWNKNERVGKKDKRIH